MSLIFIIGIYSVLNLSSRGLKLFSEELNLKDNMFMCVKYRTKNLK